MYPTNEAYRSAVYAPVRAVSGRVTFEIIDVSAAGDVSTTTTSDEQLLISNKHQLVDKIRTTTLNLSTFEPGRFRLDGSFTFSDDIENAGQLGFVSEELCGSGGLFTEPISILFEFSSKHSSAGITITFDPHGLEYATTFEVTAFDGSMIMDSVLIEGNHQVQVEALGQLTNYDKIHIQILEWSHPLRRARIVEVDFGIVRVYDDDSLIRMSLIEQMDVITARIPSAEFQFTIDNSNRDFNILNPTGFFQFLQERQMIYPELGVKIVTGTQWIPLGEYLLFEWKSDPGALTASFTARTDLDLMANFDYEQLSIHPQSLKDLAEELFFICGITNYWIDDALDTIMTHSLAKKTTCKNVLQMIAIAGTCNVFVTRGNTLTLKRIDILSPAETVELESMYEEPEITLIPIVKQVEVSYYSDIETSAVVALTNGNVRVGEVVKLERNTLINDASTAADVATWILARTNLRADWALNWRGNPAYELGDVIEFENRFGGNKTAIVTKNELQYEGFLIGRLDARGTVN